MSARNTRLFDSANVTVRADLADTDGVAVCFSNFGLLDKVSDFGNGFIQSIGWSAVFVTAKVNHWWQIPERDEMCAAIREAIGGYPKRTTYGISMGGYGALVLGGMSGCGRILALSPQTVISDPRIPLAPAWKSAIAERPILRDDVVADLAGIVPEIVYDPHNGDDRAHVDYLKARMPVTERRLPYAGHKLMLTLHQCGMLAPVMAGLIRDDRNVPYLFKRYNNARHRSPRVLQNLCRAELASGDFKAARTTALLFRALADESDYLKLANLIDSRERKASPPAAAEPGQPDAEAA